MYMYDNDTACTCMITIRHVQYMYDPQRNMIQCHNVMTSDSLWYRCDRPLYTGPETLQRGALEQPAYMTLSLTVQCHAHRDDIAIINANSI